MKIKILNIIFIIFLIGLLHYFIKDLFYTYEYYTSQTSEFMINYQGGFVRRGLIGEVLYYFTENHNIDIRLTIKILCAILYIAVCSFFVYAFRKKNYSLYILPLCFFCGAFFLGETPTDHYWIRKDNLMILFFILALLIYFKTNIRPLFKILIVNILFIFTILNHEVFVFFSLPVLFFILFRYFKKKGIYLAFIYSIICIFPTILATIITTLIHGSPDTAQIIWESWGKHFSDIPKYEDISNSVTALGWDSMQTFKNHFKLNFLSLGQSSIWSLVVWCFIFPVVYYISVNVLLVFRKTPDNFTEKHRIILSSIFLFQLLCLFPVFCILSCDYGRIFFYLSASTFAIFLIVPLYTLENLLPNIISKSAIIINRQMDKILFPTKTNVAFLMIFIFGVSNNINFSRGESILQSSLMMTVIKTLSLPFLLIKEYLFI